MRDDNDFYFEVARGARPGMTNYFATGSNTDVDAAEDVWDQGGDAPAFNSTGFALEVLSADAADDGDPAGTGALTVTIEGVSQTGAYQTATVTMNGVSAVAVTGYTWGYVNRAYVATAGTGLTNAGAITVRIASAGATKLVIAAGHGMSDGAFFYVPTGYRLFVLGVEFWTTTAGTIVAALVSSTSSGAQKHLFHTSFTTSGGRQYTGVLESFGAGTLVKARVLSVSATNQQVGATMRCILVADTAV